MYVTSLALLTIVLLFVCPKFHLVPYDVLPHSHRLSQSDGLGKLIMEVLDCWKTVLIKKFLQCDHKPRMQNLLSNVRHHVPIRIIF